MVPNCCSGPSHRQLWVRYEYSWALADVLASSVEGAALVLGCSADTSQPAARSPLSSARVCDIESAYHQATRADRRYRAPGRPVRPVQGVGMNTALVSRKFSRPSTPPSRPIPDSFRPPKGTFGDISKPFTARWPVRTRNATSKAASTSAP